MNQLIPGLSRLHHVGFTVPNLEEAIAFFTEILGFTVVSQHGPLAPHDGSLEKQFGVPSGANVKWAFLKLGESTIELGEWTVSEQNITPARNSDASGRHLALGVKDLQAAINHLQHCTDITLFEPRGSSFVYFQTSWGLLVQLVQE